MKLVQFLAHPILNCVDHIGLVIVCYITGATLEAEQKQEMIRYLRSVQCPDGGWGLLVDSFSVVFVYSTFIVPCAEILVVLID